jgi:5-methylcytosine-specific restriction endonuclease McrA
MTDFYKSKEWVRLRRLILIRDNFLCRMCGKFCAKTAHVDHIKSRKSRPDLAMEPSNLQTLCAHCHNSIKQRHEKNPRKGVGVDGFPEGGDWQ